MDSTAENKAADSFHDALCAQLRMDENAEHFPYPDPLNPKIITIGVGRNLTAVGISDDEMQLMLDNDIEKALRRCREIFGDDFDAFSEPRRVALADMAFDLEGKLADFVDMIAAIKRDDWHAAAQQELASAFARETGMRAIRIYHQLWDG